MIGNRVEVVVPLDREPAEVEAGGHAAHPVVGLEDHGLAPVLTS